jgi:cellulose synthase/poly-beta-1,6-N-acetylglucosamine synthase-like glycosyltransferase
MFWLFFYFELVRFFGVDLVVLVIWRIKLFVHRGYYAACREFLFVSNPLVSIIIPGKNEGENLYHLVESLARQTYRNYELIVIDDGSDDQTELIGRSLEQNGLISKFLRNDVRGGKASAANLGLRMASGSIVIHLDADCSFEPDAIEKILVPFYYRPNLGAVGGNVVVRNYKRSLCTSLQGIEYIDAISVGRIVASELGIYRLVSGAFGAFRRSALERIGGWDIGPGLDGDITVRLRKAGYNIHFEPGAICYTDVPVTFKALVKQRRRWDRSFVRFRLRKHRDVFYPGKSFRFSTFVSFVENVTYSMVLNVKWYIYIADAAVHFPYLLKFIIPINLLLYTGAYYLKYIIFYMFRVNVHEKPSSYFLAYIPLMPLYFGYFLRIVRTVAHIEELIWKRSYNDAWNPKKTSVIARQIGI